MNVQVYQLYSYNLWEKKEWSAIGFNFLTQRYWFHSYKFLVLIVQKVLIIFRTVPVCKANQRFISMRSFFYMDATDNLSLIINKLKRAALHQIKMYDCWSGEALCGKRFHIYWRSLQCEHFVKASKFSDTGEASGQRTLHFAVSLYHDKLLYFSLINFMSQPGKYF